MTNEANEKALTAIADFETSGGVWRRRTGRRLRKLLNKQPGQFWDAYLTELNPPSPEVAALVRSGIVNDGTTFAELDGIIRAVYAIPECKDRNQQERDAA